LGHLLTYAALLTNVLDADAVKIKLKIIAMGMLCNLELEFSPIKWVSSSNIT
jgi:hypothetical protein